MSDLLVASFSGEWGKAEGPVLTPVLRTANFNEDGTLDYANPAMRCITDKKVQAKKMRRGDIILEKSGGTPNRSVGILAYYDSDDLALCSNFNQVLRFDECKVVPRYAFYQLRWLKGRNAFDRYTRKTTGLQNLEMKRFGELELLIPEPSTQHRIADTLDKILDTQRQLDGQLTKLDSLVKSRFVEMFGDPVENPMGWPCEKLGDLGELKNGVNFKAADSGCEIKCLGVSDFKNRYSVSNMDLISTVTLNGEPTEKQMLRDGDVVFVRSNGNKQLVGRCLAVFPGDARLTFSGFCIRFRNESDSLLLDYLLVCLKSDSMRKAMSGRGANIQNLSQGLLSKVDVPLPPLELQSEFADFTARVDKLRFVFWSFLSVGAAR
ncbi:MAG: restriction endonuclease subunit S [Parafannyhessea umbonata]|nr:restriction endonuclease subunit S [Parafannyhessea umbonata]MDD6565622.1 restriction endonuclease subunit S [Parafannyhessea umbonata]